MISDRPKVRFLSRGPVFVAGYGSGHPLGLISQESLVRIQDPLPVSRKTPIMVLERFAKPSDALNRLWGSSPQSSARFVVRKVKGEWASHWLDNDQIPHLPQFYYSLVAQR